MASGVAQDGDSDDDDPLAMLDKMKEGATENELGLANTGTGSFAAPGSGYVSPVSGPPQHPGTFEISHGMVPLKGPLALMVEWLEGLGGLDARRDRRVACRDLCFL